MLVPAIHMSNIEKIVIDAVKAAQRVNNSSAPSSPATIVSQPSLNPPKLDRFGSGSSTADESLKGPIRSRASMTDDEMNHGKSGNKRNREEKTEEELHEERKAANRRSAYQSRLRKKLLIEELQGKVDNLTQQLNTMKEEKKSLQVQLESALAENRQLRFDQQAIIMSAGAGGSTGGPGFGLMGGNPPPFGNFGAANIPTAATSNPSVAALLSELQQQQQQQQQNRTGDNIGAGQLNARQFRGPL